jgi:hypothetical protein
LGAFCPSLTALAALPLHSLTEPFPVGELDLGAHPAAAAGDMEAVARDVRRALANVVQHCRTRTFTAGKLELAGGSPGESPLADTGPALLALEALRDQGVHHIKLVGLRVGSFEVGALSMALGDCLTAVTLCRCALTPGALRAVCGGAHERQLRRLRHLSFAHGCKGAGLAALMHALLAWGASDDRDACSGICGAGNGQDELPRLSPTLHIRLVKPVGEAPCADLLTVVYEKYSVLHMFLP